MRKQREIVNEHARIIAGSIFSDPTGLDHVQEHYRDHLVVGIVIKHHSRQYRRWEVELKILDPATGDTVFHARNDLRVWGRYDEPLFYPLFNAFIDWIEKNSGGPNYSLFGANPDEKVLRTQ